jgi:hypothetical protein
MSSLWAKRRRSYPDSGFDPLLQSIERLSQDLIPLIEQTVLRETSGLLKAHLKVIEQKRLEIQGEAADAKAKEEELSKDLSLLEICLSNLDAISGKEVRKWRDAVSPYRLVYEVETQLDSCSSEERFEEEWSDCVTRLQGLMRPFLKSLDKAEENCRRELKKVEMEPLRAPDTSLLPPKGRLRLSWKWITETKYERRWYTLWLYRHEKKVRRRVLDREESMRDLSRYAQDVGTGLSNHLRWWREKHFHDRYRTPAQKRVDQIREMRAILRNVSADDEGDLLRIEELLAQIAAQIPGFRAPGQPEKTSTSQGLVGEEKLDSTSEDCHPLIRLLSSYRELGLHRRLLSILYEQAGSVRRPVMVCLGARTDDVRKLVGLLRHDVQSAKHLELVPGFSVFCSPDMDPSVTADLGSKCKVFSEDLTIWKHMECVIPDTTGHTICEADWRKLLATADAVAVFVNLSQIGSGLNDLNSSPWSRMAPTFREKTFYINVQMALFDKKLHEIVTQVIPTLWEQSPFGERPFFLSEDYDVRYTDFTLFGLRLCQRATVGDLPARRAVARWAVLKWQEERIPMSPPFTKKLLKSEFSKIASDTRQGQIIDRKGK